MVDVWPEKVTEIFVRRGLSEWALRTERCDRYRDIRGFSCEISGCLRGFDS